MGKMDYEVACPLAGIRLRWCLLERGANQLRSSLWGLLWAGTPAALAGWMCRDGLFCGVGCVVEFAEWPALDGRIAGI